jgi:hypothetical protein
MPVASASQCEVGSYVPFIHRLLRSRLTIAALILIAGVVPASAQDRLCDPGDEDCRAILINYIRSETVAIDVAFWFMEDARYTNELIRKHQAGVPVRVLMDPRANASYPLNQTRLAELQSAGIPMRKRLTNYILHWKMMLFHGQNLVQFSGANYSADAWRPGSGMPYQNYVDEGIYFTTDTAIVNSFRTRFDDQWVNTTEWANYANVSGPLNRRYGIFPKDPSLNFAPWENFRTRSVNSYADELRKIDVVMYRITDRAHADGMLAAVARGIGVRLITEPDQYRDDSRMWHAWNVDRLYMGGVQIKHRAHQGLNHQKSVILYDQDPFAPGDQSMVIFGSSNWTSPSAAGQVEHNIFTGKPYVTTWFINQFERKWNNLGGLVENVDFVPLPPDAPKNPAPAPGAGGVQTSMRFTWAGGPWAHLYDLYLDTNPNPTTLIALNLAETPSKTATSVFNYTPAVPLRPGRTYYWRVVGKTMAHQARSSPVWSFTTAGSQLCAGRVSDFDGDCRSDITVFRPVNGTWYQLFSGTTSSAAVQWGTQGDIPAPGDYNGDGHQDIAVFRPSDGTWYVRDAVTGVGRPIQWGTWGDVPTAGDYDGDGRTDTAIFRPGNGMWYLRFARSGAGYAVQWGTQGDVPVPGDYDGDGRTDVAIFRPANGTWYLLASSTGAGAGYQWGGGGDIPVPGDYDGDGRTDCAVFRPSNVTWYVRYSRTGATASWQFGNSSDRPAPGDYDGDGITDLAVFRPSNAIWYLRYSSTGATGAVQWGSGSDIPIW